MTNDSKVVPPAKRKPPNAGKGRVKGVPNKTTALLKDALLMAGENAHEDGLVGYLTKQAKENPNAFLPLLGKVIPLQITGDAENPLEINVTIGGESKP